MISINEFHRLIGIETTHIQTLTKNIYRMLSILTPQEKQTFIKNFGEPN